MSHTARPAKARRPHSQSCLSQMAAPAHKATSPRSLECWGEMGCLVKEALRRVVPVENLWPCNALLKMRQSLQSKDVGSGRTVLVRTGQMEKREGMLEQPACPLARGPELTRALWPMI